MDTVRTQLLGAAPASRLYAMVNVAMYDAVNGIDRARRISQRDHTSGQSTFAGAGSTILAGFYRNDNITFTFEGDNAVAGPRTFHLIGISIYPAAPPPCDKNLTDKFTIWSHSRPSFYYAASLA